MPVVHPPPRDTDITVHPIIPPPLVTNCTPVVTTDITILTPILSSLNLVSNSIPIPISTTTASSSATTDTTTNSLNRHCTAPLHHHVTSCPIPTPKRSGIPFPEAKPILNSPESTDPWRYSTLLEDRHYQHSTSSTSSGVKPISSPCSRRSSLHITHTCPSSSSPCLSPSLSSDLTNFHNNHYTSSPINDDILVSSSSSYTSPRLIPSPIFTSSPRKFVGSYEESLISRRLSARPSNPIHGFSLTVGALGIGKCKPALRCPPHVTLPFSAHYYKLEDNDIMNSTVLNNNHCHLLSPPSCSVSSTPTWTPYVGVIDLRSMTNHTNNSNNNNNNNNNTNNEFHRLVTCNINGYHIPPQGQLQFIVKNPQQNAVKLFLVPYNLFLMPRCTKSAIRHKQYVCPQRRIINVSDNKSCVITTNSDIISDSTVLQTETQKRTLRYALHIPIICTKQGKHYLAGGNLRVVFSGKCPESYERLDTETTLVGGYTEWKNI